MSKSEQDALLAYFNTFKLARRVNTFASLADGKVLMEVSLFSKLKAWLIKIGDVSDVSYLSMCTSVSVSADEVVMPRTLRVLLLELEVLVLLRIGSSR